MFDSLKPVEIITLIGIMLTFFVSILNQINTKKNIKHTKFLENIIVSNYLDLKEIKKISTLISNELISKSFLSDDALYKELLLNLSILEVEIQFFRQNEKIKKIIFEIKDNVINRYNIDYSKLSSNLISETINLFRKNSDYITEKYLNQTRHKSERDKNVWGF